MFQSTPLREGRHGLNDGEGFDMTFQSTPLREGRHIPATAFALSVSFNPRPYVRGDVRSVVYPFRSSRFQSTPLREGRHQG